MAFYFVQFLTGLASAASLFLVASGLSIIFGVTRIVNFAHGAFYMIGAYIAFTLTEEYFRWVVQKMADLTIRLTREPRPAAGAQSWNRFLQGRLPRA